MLGTSWQQVIYISNVRPHEAAEPATSMFVVAFFGGPFMYWGLILFYYMCFNYMILGVHFLFFFIPKVVSKSFVFFALLFLLSLVSLVGNCRTNYCLTV